MIVRALNKDNDWTFGVGKSNYKSRKDCVAQNLQTRLSSYVNDCFFATADGIDWLNLLGDKNQLAIQLAVSSVILNTQDVLAINTINFSIDSKRNMTIQYSVTTSFGTVTNEIESPIKYLTTESNNILITEDGERIRL